MLNQRFVIELTGITRMDAAEVVAEYYGIDAAVRSAGADKYEVHLSDGRCWLVVSNSGINGKAVELISPNLAYGDMDDLRKILCELHKAGAKSHEYKI